MPQGGCLAFDGRMVSGRGAPAGSDAGKKQAQILSTEDLVDLIGRIGRAYLEREGGLVGKNVTAAGDGAESWKNSARFMRQEGAEAL